MRRYKLEHEPLPEMKLYSPFVDGEDGFMLLVSGDVDNRLIFIASIIEQLEKFRKECYRFIDREKNRTLLAPYIARIEELESKEIKK